MENKILGNKNEFAFFIFDAVGGAELQQSC
jgi:hypothetical protein